MKILPSAVPHWERGLGLDCENSTTNYSLKEKDEFFSVVGRLLNATETYTQVYRILDQEKRV